MEIREILDRLDHWDDEKVPSALLLAAVDAKDEITADLILAIEDVVKDPAKYIDADGGQLYYWAIYLLTHLKATDAFPVILKWFKLNKTDFHPLVSDIISEDGAMILTNLCGGKAESICEILHDNGAPDDNRAVAALSIGFLCVRGELEVERVEAEYRRALETVEKDDVSLSMELVNGAADLNLRGLAPDITRAFDRGAVDPDDFEFVAEWLHDPDFEPPPPYMLLHQGIEDIVEFFETKFEEDRLAEEYDPSKDED